MKRFIFLTFGFMALAFYELSGGGEFDPEATRLASIETREALEAARKQGDDISVVALAPAPAGEVVPVPADRDNDAVTRAELNLVSFESVTNDETPSRRDLQVEPLALQETQRSTEEAEELVKLSGYSKIDGVASGITFAGLSTTASSDAVAPTLEIAPPKDIRIVSGSLVNVRSGPGGDFRVVDQLTEDTRVEVLEDAGNGWVRLRTITGGTTGWMADFLLTDS